MTENGVLNYIDVLERFWFKLLFKEYQYESDLEPITLEEFHNVLLLYAVFVICTVIIFVIEVFWFRFKGRLRPEHIRNNIRKLKCRRVWRRKPKVQAPRKVQKKESQNPKRFRSEGIPTLNRSKNRTRVSTPMGLLSFRKFTDELQRVSLNEY